MKLKELRDMIAFEAKLGDSIDTLGGWLDTTMAEIFDSYTSQVKYAELFVPDTVFSLPDITGIVLLPDDVQHLELDSIRFRRDGEITGEYYLYIREGSWGENVGRTRYVLANSNSTNLKQLRLWPITELTVNDDLVFSYYRKAIPSNASDDLVLQPDQLVPVVKLAMIARASLFGGSKQYQIFRQLTADAHSRSMGATNLGTTNG